VIDTVTGGIASIYDKELKVELVDKSSPYRVNQYIYENPEGNRDSVDNMKVRARFKRYSPSSAKCSAEVGGPVASSIVVRTSAKRAPSLTHQIVLYDDIKRIDIINMIDKEETYDLEAVYYAFPFDVKGGIFRFEIADAMMSPETEQLPRTTRDWHTVQHWIEISNKDCSVVWSPIEAPLVQFCDINTGKWLEKLDITNTWFFSYAMNNYWMTNFKASQGGKITLRYSITSHRGGTDHFRASQFGWGYHTPLIAAVLHQHTDSTLSGTAQTFLNIDAPNVIVQAFKQAEDGKGIIVRLRELEGKETTVKVLLPLFKVSKAYLTNIVEVNQKPLKVVENALSVSMRKFDITTIRIIYGK